MNTADSYQSGSILPSGYSRALVVLSWCVIVLFVLSMVISVTAVQYIMPRGTSLTDTELITVNMQAKMLVFSKSWGQAPPIEQLDPLKKGPIEQRLIHVFLVNELIGADAASEQLNSIAAAVKEENKHLESDIAKPTGASDLASASEIETEAAQLELDGETVAVASTESAADEKSVESNPTFLTEDQLELQSLATRIIHSYRDGDDPSVTDDERDLLDEKLGWTGKLAMLDPDSSNEADREALVSEASRIGYTMVFGVLAVFCALASGAFVIFCLIALFKTGKLNFKLQHKCGHGYVYIETFAIWIIVFIGLQLCCGLLAVILSFPTLGMMLVPLAFFGSLVALVWPWLRGIPLQTLRTDIGLDAANPFVEMFTGGVAYVALSIPLLIGMITSGLLGSVLEFGNELGDFESTVPAGHPITDEITSGGSTILLFVVLSACVAAPIVEEIMFRGVLYRYLRDATSHFRARWISIAASAIFGGLIFAAIHPQGLIGIPVLTSLAAGFALVREWRNSLIAPMVMHAIHNSLTVTMLLVMLG